MTGGTTNFSSQSSFGVMSDQNSEKGFPQFTSGGNNEMSMSSVASQSNYNSDNLSVHSFDSSARKKTGPSKFFAKPQKSKFFQH